MTSHEDMDFEVLPLNAMDVDGNEDVFKQPVCLIGTDGSGRLQANENALRQIEDIANTVNVVAIAGLYRTGKSYLLNRLAGAHKGFALGSTIESKTKGIWVWCTKHPVHKDQTLVLLDTEGLGDVAKGDANHDHWIFALATLLSSTLVYNTLGALDQGAIEKLNFVTEMSKHIKTRGSDSGNKDFDMYFPAFIVTLRDFTLELELNGREITADEYLEHALSLRKETDELSKRFNEPRRCIRRYFKSRKCFTFERPGNKHKLRKLETLTDDDLDEEFVSNVQAFCRFVFDKCDSKKLDTGAEVNGRMFSSLVRSYVEAIRNGAVPCIENALNTMAKQENGKAIEAALKLYSEIMGKAVKLPTDTDDELSTAHHRAVKDAVAVFMKKVIYDDDNTFQRKLNGELEVVYNQWKKRNEDVSVEKTQDVLDNLNNAIAEKLKKGVYLCNGGYAMYQTDLHKLQAQFESAKGLGVKAKDTFLEFLNKKFVEGESILAADQKVTAEEKKVEAERQKAIEAQRQQEIAQREADLKAKHAEDVERMMQENIKQLEKKREEEIANMKKHHEEVISSRLEEQKRTLDEGFKREASELQNQISQLQKQQQEQQRKKKKGGCFADTSLVRVKAEDGKVSTVYLSELKVGDRVESYDFKTKQIVFSPVYFITHSTGPSTKGSPLLCLELEGGSHVTRLRLDQSHLVYAAPGDVTPSCVPDLPVRANQVNVGDVLWVRRGEGLAPRKVRGISDTKAGIRHPMTMNHVIIVDSVLASVHMHYERIYRALTSPLRLLYAVSPTVVQSGFVTSTVNAFDYVENFL